MRALFMALLFFPFSCFAICEEESLIVDDKKLSLHWAQEYTGSDLAREFLATLKERLSLKKVPTAVFDLGFEKEHISIERNIPIPPQMNGRRTMRAHHGTSVVNLIAGPDSLRMTDYADIMSLEAISFGSRYAYAFRNYEKKGTYPKIISNSLGWTSDSIPTLVKEAHDKGILWFLASGNDYPTPVNTIEVNSKALMVGSYSPSGLTSANTQNHQNLLVLAPANEELRTINGYGDIHLFGETSGATPLVAATAINMLSLFPELTPDLVSAIIKENTLFSGENKLGLTQMPGLLNHYGAVIATYQLREDCRADIHCAKERVLNGGGKAVGPHSILTCKDVIKNTCDKKRVVLENQIKSMRINILLGHEEIRMQQARELACVYQHFGFQKNSEFYQFLSKENLDLEHMEKEAKKNIEQNIYRRSYYRYGPYYSDSYREYIQNDSPLTDYHKKWHLSLETKHLEGLE